MPFCFTLIDSKKAFDTVETEAVLEALGNQVGLAEVTATGKGEGDDLEKPYVFWDFTYVKFFRVICKWYKYGCWLIKPYADLTPKEKQMLGDKSSS
ncbi:hypothetical protein ANCCEY_08069 [Ancylostoma ceylanicum]|uniref:Reverse transcriptase domain-containing protein n=1 Tax=Ancylostoma ceylanicum TaxID=53326 RepID=A0A0D6LNQ5_9BILA|nr:hypothetical protein ANCCEY_08069 [Ancylostoma ceylanicum]